MVSYKISLYSFWPSWKLFNFIDHLEVPWYWNKYVHGRTWKIIGHLLEKKKQYFSNLKPFKGSNLDFAFLFTPWNQHFLINWKRIPRWSSWGLNPSPLGLWWVDHVSTTCDSSLDTFHIQTKWSSMHRFWCQLRSNQICFGWQKITPKLQPEIIKSLIFSESTSDGVIYLNSCSSFIGVWKPGEKPWSIL